MGTRIDEYSQSRTRKGRSRRTHLQAGMRCSRASSAVLRTSLVECGCCIAPCWGRLLSRSSSAAWGPSCNLCLSPFLSDALSLSTSSLVGAWHCLRQAMQNIQYDFTASLCATRGCVISLCIVLHRDHSSCKRRTGQTSHSAAAVRLSSLPWSWRYDAA